MQQLPFEGLHLLQYRNDKILQHPGRIQVLLVNDVLGIE